MTKGREFNHIEDLVFFYGSEGATQATDILASFASSQDDISIKWDGKAALYYGRDSDGKFCMATIYGWRKNKPSYTPEDIRTHVLTVGQGEDWRKLMAQDFYHMFGFLEQSVPTDFKGFVKGDLIFSPLMVPVKPTLAGYQFTPNQVTYTVNSTSQLGHRVANALIGMALHNTYSEWGSSDETPIDNSVADKLSTEHVLAFGQTYVNSNPDVDLHKINLIENMIEQNGAEIDELLEKRQGLSDMPNIIYTFVNQTSRAGQLDKINTTGFIDWLLTSKVSANKQERIKTINTQSNKMFPALFELTNAVMEAKNEVIAQLDKQDGDITARTGDQPGGEGYVSLKNKVKLIPRHRWTPFKG